jgi:hypothetical protein
MSLALIVLGVWCAASVAVAAVWALIGLGLRGRRVSGETRLPRGQTPSATSPEIVQGRWDAGRGLPLRR